MYHAKNISFFLKIFLKTYKKTIIVTLCLITIIVLVLTGPKTVEYGNGYFHQIGSFGECDIKADDCTVDATHRRHYFLWSENYCESCWECYGKDMFERLSKKNTSNGIEYDEFKCRHTGCNKRAKTSDWDHRFCEEHIKGTKYCRYPNCSEQIPISGTSKYCWKHK